MEIKIGIFAEECCIVLRSAFKLQSPLGLSVFQVFNKTEVLQYQP